MKKYILFSVLAMVAITLGFGFHIYRAVNQPPKEPIIPAAIGKFDPYLGWSLRASTSASSSRTGEKILYTIDEIGLREMDNTGAKDECRIIAVGDSNTFGFGTAITNHWLTHLRNNIPALTIYNLGVQGFGIDQVLLRLELMAPQIKPRLIIVYIPHLNDDRHLHAVRWGSAKPYFTENSDGDLKLNTEHILQMIDPEKITEPIYEDRLNALFRVGKKIVQRMELYAKKLNVPLVVAVGKSKLCSLTTEMCWVVKMPLKSGIIDRYGENLFHLNSNANKFLGDHIATQLKKEKFLPQACLN